ncbi:MAG: cobalamin-dependent protein [Nitrososphaerota archaeon]|nr:cobalamin-dependent protein [Candidatus Bathyarchaeota archaeon]MDW8062376.1 cobalamin-dependent protein [Nitrososphaerota archaeon]
MPSLDELIEAFVELDEGRVLSLVEKLIVEIPPPDILEACRKATVTIGERFEKGEYFLSELVYAGEIFRRIMDIVLPKLREEVKPIATIVLGTVEGDIHDIGKNIFKAFAEAAGFKVVDLGVDTSPDRFVEAVRRYNPEIVGMSGLLTIAIESMRRVVEALKQAGLRDRVKIIIGGGRVDKYAKRYTGADDWADNAMLGVRKCKRLIGLEG